MYTGIVLLPHVFDMSMYAYFHEHIHVHNINRDSLSVSTQVSDGGVSPELGQNYTLTCNVSVHVTSYNWTKDGKVLEGEVNGTLFFPSLNLSSAGPYACEVIVNSTTYRADNRSILLASKFLSLQLYQDIYYFLLLHEVPEPSSIVLTSNKRNPIRPVGSNVMLTCTVELSPAVDVPMTVYIEWTGPDGLELMTNVSAVDSNTTYTSTVMITSFGRNHSGNYTCTAIVKQVSSQYINDREAVTSNETRITTGMWVQLH